VRTALIIVLIGLVTFLSVPRVGAGSDHEMGNHMQMAGLADCAGCPDMVLNGDTQDGLPCLHGMLCLPNVIIEASGYSLEHHLYPLRYPRAPALARHSPVRSLDLPPPRVLSVLT
jgi:hypothetical protein